MPNLQTPAPTFDDVWRTIKELAKSSKDSHKERAAEMDRMFRETDREIKEVGRQIGNLGNRLGSFTEEMVKPGLVRLFRERGLKVNRRTMQNLARHDAAGQFLEQVDLLMSDGDMAIAVECKSHLSVDDVNEHLERLTSFKEHWPEYARYRLHGGVAAMVLPDEVGRYAYRKGLYVLAQSGEQVEIRNDAKFEPRVW